MTKNIISQSTTDGLFIDGPGDKWVITKGVTIDNTDGPTLDDAGGGTMDQDFTEFIVKGTVKNSGGYFLVDAAAEGLNFTITETGRAKGYIRSYGDEFSLVNAGVVKGGLSLHGTYQVENSGKLFGQIVVLDDATGRIVNKAGGLIQADDAARGITPSAGFSGAFDIVNKGTIRGDDVNFVIYNHDSPGADKVVNKGLIDGKIHLGNGDDRLVNRGTIAEYIDMGDGNDIIDLRKGTLTEFAYGNGGDDIYYVDSFSDPANPMILESQDDGTDTVFASVNFTLGENFEKLKGLGNKDLKLTGNELNNTLSGNNGANVLRGMEGEDKLVGGLGDDILIGGANSDTFAFFAANIGIDHIKDFEVEGEDMDLIELNLIAGFQDFTDVQAHMSTNGQGNTVINIGDGNKIIIDGVAHTDLTAGHFDVNGMIILP